MREKACPPDSKQTERGRGLRLARGVQHLQGYGKRSTFASVSAKSETVCEVSGDPGADHFVDVNNMVDIGSGTPIPAYLWFLAKNKPGGKRCQPFILDLAA